MNEIHTYTEPELVYALKKRSNEAFRYLYMNYRGSLYAVITQLIPETETANDVLQELFITIWNNIEKYDPSKGKLYTWLFNLARNTAINKIRSKNYKNTLKNEELSKYVNSIEEKNEVNMNINQIGLRKEVSRLKVDHRQVVELAYFSGFTHEEIAKALNIPLGTIKTRLRNALIELRKQMR